MSSRNPDAEDTPVIDEGLILRAKQIDWNKPGGIYAKAPVQCERGYHRPWESRHCFDLLSDAIVAESPCPECGSHRLSRATVSQTSR